MASPPELKKGNSGCAKMASPPESKKQNSGSPNLKGSIYAVPKLKKSIHKSPDSKQSDASNQSKGVACSVKSSPSMSKPPSVSKPPSTGASPTQSRPRSRQGSRISGKGSKSLPSDDDTFQDDFFVEVLTRDVNVSYGCFGFNPGFLQWFRRKPVAFLVVLFLLMSSNLFIHGVIPPSAVHLIRGFYFSGYEVAVIQSAYHIGTLVALFPVAYYAERGIHRPYWIGVGGLVSGLGGLIMVTTHILIKGEPSHPEVVDLCEPITKPPLLQCDKYEFHKTVFLFMFGEFMLGIGMAPCYVMGITFLDENVISEQSAVYTAILSASRCIGPALALIVTSGLLKVFGEVDKTGLRTSETDYQYRPGEPNWYGAWWISILIGVGFSWFGAALMFPFPRELSGRAVAQAHDARKTTMAQQGGHDVYEQEGGQPVGMGRKMQDLLTNGVFIGIMLEHVARIFVLSGINTFLPQYFRLMFDSGSAETSLLLGIFVALMAVIGLAYGTVVQYFFRLQVLGNLRLCLVGAIITVLFSPSFFIRCDVVPFAGITESYPNSTGHTGPIDQPNLAHECNRDCACTAGRFTPVCYVGDTAVTSIRFFSECHAGCKKKLNESDDEIYFTDCQCVPGYPSQNATVKRGKCKTSECSWKLRNVFILCLCWLHMSLYGRWNSAQQIMLRTVHFKLRGLALGVAEVSARIVAFTAPLFFAHIVVDACRHRDKCTDNVSKGRCFWHDRQALSIHFAAAVTTLCTISFIGVMVALFAYREPMPNVVCLIQKSPKWSATPKIASPMMPLKETDESKEDEQEVQ